MKMKAIKKLLIPLLISGIAIISMVGITALAETETSDESYISSYFHSEDGESSYFLTSYEYEKFGEEFEAVGVTFQKSDNGKKYYITNPEAVEQWLEQLAQNPVVVDDKHSATIITKYVGKQSNDIVYSDIYMTGNDTLFFKTTVGVGTAKKVVVYDFVPKQLKKQNLKIERIAKGSTDPSTLTESKDYTVTKSEDEDVYTIASACGDTNGGCEIVLTYEVELENVSVLEDLDNQIFEPYAYAKYSETEGATPNETSKSYQKINITKLVLENGLHDKSAYQNVKFELYDITDNNNTLLKFTSVGEKNGNNYYYYDESGSTSTITLSTNDNIAFSGLTVGRKYKIQFTSLDGVENLMDSYEFEWQSNTNKVVVKLTDLVQLEIADTGGNGTTLVYTLGSLFIVSAILILFAGKKNYLH